MQSRTARVLSYKEQELLNWHIQKKRQEEEVAHTGNDRTQADGMVHGMTQQSLLDQRPHSHTPPQSIRRHTPPKSPRPPSPGLFARPMIPVPSPSEDLPPPVTLICKEESHRDGHGSVEVKVSSRTPKEELAEVLTVLGQRKSPTLRESGIPETLKEKKKDQHHSNAHESVEVTLNSQIPKEELTELITVFGQSSTPRESGRLETPKEKKKDSHSPGRRPGSPKEDLGRVGRAGSPKDKQGEVKAGLRTDQTMHTLSWSNMPEFQKPSLTWAQPATTQPKFLDPSFMCQNQLELPCIAAAREEQNQKSYPFAQLSTRPAARTPKPQCLAHTIIQSLDSEQAMQDLKMHLAKGLEMGSSQPSVEYPLCLLCGRCTPYCPHPRMRHSPCLLVYPRLDVQDGNAYMTLGFLLKIKRSEADMWGLTQGTDVLKKPCDKERPSKREKSKRTTPHRKSQGRAAGPRPQGPKIPDKTPHVAREHLPERGNRKTRNPVAAQQVARVAATTPAPASAQTTKTQFQPRSARPPPLSARPSPVSAKPSPPPPKKVHPKTPEKPHSILKQLLSTIKNIWAKVRNKCPEKFCPKKSSPSKKPDSPQFARVSPQPRKEPGALLSLKSSTSEVQKKGAISKVSPLSPSTQKVSPLKSATPPILKRASFTKQTSPTDRRRPSLSFKEPDSPKVSQKGTSSTKKSTSPGTPRKSPSLLKRTPSKKSTSKIARHPD
ncbi:serine/arginine repetitive matrix protein 1-like [Sphaerodactylus townsendi]|uniref:serine/arginine repetitive matrix protein 1-like n=1 Tax=Sphaerodactylus townsendi TaxID=933632 RepID=UPI0020268083|nr:serine/arginine repetitive matrix protein 1-like [Sphaerodactylus townsendi]